MASNYFTINPTSGTGDGQVIVTPTGTNMTITDRKATVTIGGETVAVTHYGIPSIARVGGQEPVVAPASGATYQYKVQTHYQVQFCNKPDWITIDDGQGNYISSAQTISAAVANGKTYNFNVAPNATNNQRETPANFGLWHYINGTLQQLYDEVSISQPQGASDYINVIGSTSLDWDDTNGKVITIDANVPYTVSHTNTTDFTLNGGNGYVTIRANDVNSGTTIKTTTISIASTKPSFTYTATCVTTQLREPRINNVGGSSVAWSGGTLYAEVTSDYYWWPKPTVRPDTNAYFEYITMSAKTMDENMQPIPSGQTFSLDFNQNTGASPRQNYIRVGYTKNDGTIASSSTSFYFNQANQASTTFEVVPGRIPESGYVSSGGGVYTLNVVTQRPWLCEITRRWCTVSPTSGVGNTTVTVTVPPASAQSSSYQIVEGLSFLTNDAEMRADQTVYVYQYDRYVEPPYINVDPVYFEVGSGLSTNHTVEIDTNTNWTAVVNDEWIDMTVTTGTSAVTSVTFDVARNYTQSVRDGSITFYNSRTGVTVNVRQAAGAPAENFFVVTSTPSTGISFNSGTTGSIGKYITVSASTDWNVTSKPNWISLGSSPFGGTNVIGGTSGSTIVYPRPSENSGASRSGYVTMTSVAGLSGMSALITQSSGYTPQQDFLIVTTTPATGITYTSAGTVETLDTTKYIQVSASTSFVISSKPSWLELSSSALHPSPSQGGGVGNNKFYPIIAANSGNARSGYVTFSGGGQTGTSALISQEEAYTPSTYGHIFIEPEGAITNISADGTLTGISFYYENDVTNPQQYTINYDGELDEWAVFKDGPYEGSSDVVYSLEPGNVGYIYLHVQPNDGYPRTGTVIFEGTGDQDTVTFYISQQ